MIHSTDEEIAQVIERLSWSADDLVLILFSTNGLPTIFMDRGFCFYKVSAIQSSFQLEMPIAAKLIGSQILKP